MEKIKLEYKRLKEQLTENLGCEDNINEVGWNDMIKESMEDLLKDVHPHIAKLIQLNHV